MEKHEQQHVLHDPSAPGPAGAHLYEIHAADGRVLHQWADSPFEACALLGLLYTTVLGVALIC